jgi:DNA methylase
MNNDRWSEKLIFDSFGHKVYNADSTNREFISDLIMNEKINAIVFDPPYEIKDIYTHIPNPSPGMALILFYDYKHFGAAIYNAISKGWLPKFELIWDCCGSVIEDGRPLNSHKSCAVFGDFEFKNKLSLIKNSVRSKKCNSERLKSIEKFKQSEILHQYGHKHAKPHDWLRAIFSGVRGNAYLDMFAGSGSTLLVCMEMGIRTVLIEKEIKLCEKIVSSFSNKLTKCK